MGEMGREVLVGMAMDTIKDDGNLATGRRAGHDRGTGMPYEVPRLMADVFCLLSLLRHVLS
jgi:hypothetical protein